MSHPIRKNSVGRAAHRAAPPPPQWPSYDGTAQFVGTSPSGRVTVYVDPSLGTQAFDNANDLVNDADRVANANDAIFGTTGGPVSVIVFALGGATDGTGGADHDGCDYTSGAAIEVCASFGNSPRVSAHLAYLAPWTVELAGKVFASILADIAAGKETNQIVAGVRAVLVTAPKLKPISQPPALCHTRSHRLLRPGEREVTRRAA
jgi:hypothetical protein